jgi:hypothetical protein
VWDLHAEHCMGMGPCLREAYVRMGNALNKGISEVGRIFVECPSCVREPAGAGPITAAIPKVGAETIG